MSERTGISAVTSEGKKTTDIKTANKLFFDVECLRNKLDAKELLSDDEVMARCEAIAVKLNFLGSVISSTKFDGTLVVFKSNNSQVEDIAIPVGC